MPIHVCHVIYQLIDKKQKADELNPINQYFTFLFPLQIQQLGMNHCEEKCIIS